MNDACFSTFSTLLGCSGEDVVVDCARNATGIFFARLNAALLFSIFPAIGGNTLCSLRVVVVVVVALPTSVGGKDFCWNAATIDLTGDGARIIVSIVLDASRTNGFWCSTFSGRFVVLLKENSSGESSLL